RALGLARGIRRRARGGDGLAFRTGLCVAERVRRRVLLRFILRACDQRNPANESHESKRPANHSVSSKTESSFSPKPAPTARFPWRRPRASPSQLMRSFDVFPSTT